MFFKNLIFAFLLFIFGVSCNSRESKTKVSIRIAAVDKANISVNIIQYKDLSEVILSEIILDSIGGGILDFELQNATIAYLQIDNQFAAELYLNSGYNLIFSQGINATGKFEGNGAEVNNYLSEIRSLSEKIKLANGKYISQLSIVDFQRRFDSLNTAMNVFHQHYTDSLSFQKEILKMLDEKNRIKLTSIYWEYLHSLQNRRINAKLESFKKGEDFVEDETQTILQGEKYPMIFNSEFLNLGSAEYNYLLRTFLKNEIYIPNYDITDWVGMVEYLPTKTYEIIKAASYPDDFIEYMHAEDIKYWINYYGVTSATKGSLLNFNREFQNSRYALALQDNYDAWIAISPGSIAPALEGITMDGKIVALSALKGKIVYVDMWATWCGPCIEEIPHSISLMENYRKERGIEFLNVSSDANQEHWKKLLMEKANWGGTHINIQGPKADAIWKAYKIFGLPNYFLIDKMGNIVTVNAARPSDPKIRNQIDSLLKVSQ